MHHINARSTIAAILVVLSVFLSGAQGTTVNAILSQYIFIVPEGWSVIAVLYGADQNGAIKAGGLCEKYNDEIQLTATCNLGVFDITQKEMLSDPEIIGEEYPSPEGWRIIHVQIIGQEFVATCQSNKDQYALVVCTSPLVISGFSEAANEY